jgi:hypothetical protein
MTIFLLCQNSLNDRSGAGKRRTNAPERYVGQFTAIGPAGKQLLTSGGALLNVELL